MIPENYGTDLPGKGRSVLVTGASSGIGLEISLYLAERGFHVYAAVRQSSRRDLLEDRMRGKGLPLAVVTMDVTRPEEIAGTRELIENREGPLYGVVNNAGIIVRGFFEDLTDEEMRRVFETNFFAALSVTREVLPGMRKTGRGRIVMIGSTGGRIGTAGSSAYCTAKFALAGFTESLAQEVRPFGIHVSLIEPGIMHTELFGKNLGVGSNASRPQGPYASMFERLMALSVERSRASSLKPADVAGAVGRALLDPHPRMRYVVGRNARWVFFLKRYLPEEAFQRGFTRTFFRQLGTNRNRAGLTDV